MTEKFQKFNRFDEVAMKCPNSGLVNYGMVVDTNVENLESESNEKDVLKQMLKVWWHPKGPEEIVMRNKLMLMDRYMEPYFRVSRISDERSKMVGLPLNINIHVTIKILNTNKIIENINSQHITDIKQFEINNCVINDTMHVGDILNLQLSVTLASDDGSVFTIDAPNGQHFISLYKSDVCADVQDIFHHGKMFKMNPKAILNAKFITISNLMNNKISLWRSCNKKCIDMFGSKWINVCVKDIAVISVLVNWFSRLSGRELTVEEHVPQPIYEGDDIKYLSTFDVFGYSAFIIGRKCFYTIKDTDNIITEEQWRTKCTKALNIKCRLWPKKNKKIVLLNRSSSAQDGQKSSATKVIKNKTRKNSIYIYRSYRLRKNRMPVIINKKGYKTPKVSLKVNSKVMADICYTKSFVDVLWENGVEELGIPSTELYAYMKNRYHKFYVHDIVTKKNENLSTYVYGVIESINYKTLFSRVQWFKICTGKPPFYESFSIPIEKTEINTYHLRHNNRFQFRYGMLVKNNCPISNQYFLIGQVRSIGQNGKVSIMWVNGEMVECWPQNISALNSLNRVNENDTSNIRMSLACVKILKESLKNDLEISKKSKHTEIHLFKLLKHCYSSILLFLQASKYNEDLLKDKKLKIINRAENGPLPNPQPPTSEIDEDEILHEHLNNIKNKIEEIIAILDNKEERAEELSFEILIRDITDILENVLPDTLNQFNLAIKDF